MSRLLILSLSLREHLRKLFHVLPFRDVPSAVPAHDHLLGILGPTKAKPIGDHPSFSCQGLEGWKRRLQPCNGGCTSTGDSTIGLHPQPSWGSLPGHPPVMGSGTDEPCCCCLLVCLALQTAHHRCLQQPGAVPACGHPGSGTRRQSHHL